ESGVRSQESGVRSQESGVGSNFLETLDFFPKLAPLYYFPLPISPISLTSPTSPTSPTLNHRKIVEFRKRSIYVGISLDRDGRGRYEAAPR
ncbi:hypothetical protein V0288_02205, partial [Pannus brasiliensis CCIBt3594]